MRPNLSSAALPGLMLLAGIPGWSIASAQTASAQPSATPGKDEYAALLKRVQEGDTTVDMRAFRIAGVLSLGAHGGMREAGERHAFRKLADSRDYQGALDSANAALARNYASIVNHFDAMVACQALQKTGEAAIHQKLLNALLDSIQNSGDGKSPETAWFVVTTNEEYLFLGRVLGVKVKSQGLVPKDGHFYDRMEVINPKTDKSQSVWFNTDMDMGAYKPSGQNKGGPPN